MTIIESEHIRNMHSKCSFNAEADASELEDITANTFQVIIFIYERASVSSLLGRFQ